MSSDKKSVAQLLRERAAADPAGHARSLARGYGVGPDVYERFIEEVDALSIHASDPAAKVVGDLTRAVKRAQMVYDGVLEPVQLRQSQ